MAGELEDVITACEGCGAEDPVLAAKVRTFRLTNGGNDPKVPATPLRSPFYCAACRTSLNEFVAALRSGTAKTIHVKRDGQILPGVSILIIAAVVAPFFVLRYFVVRWIMNWRRPRGGAVSLQELADAVRLEHYGRR